LSGNLKAESGAGRRREARVQGIATRLVAAEFGAFAAGAGPIPEAVLHQGRRALLNCLGTALGSAKAEAVDRAARAVRAVSGPGEATVIGRPERLRAAEAGFVNAIAMNLLDFDDTHLPTIIHPTAPVAPAALALGEELGSSGAEVLAAFVLGAEITCRVGNMVSPGHYARGWHITSTCGTFGAAAAAARLLRLDDKQTAHALGVASSLAAGNVENLPTAGKNASVGNAVRGGILAAHLAREGFQAAPAALEGRLGWARASGDVPDVERALSDLGRSWEFSLNAIKPYPCGIVFHAEIDACLDLRREHGGTPDEIERVTVKGDALFLARGDREVRSAGDGRVSIHHIAAVALLYGRAGVREFEQACVDAPEVVAFRAKVRGELDSSLAPGAVTVELRLRDGRDISATVVHARGSIEHPLSDAEVEEKARCLAEWGGTGCDLDRLAGLVWRIDALPEVRSLMAAASGAGA
jgi:2-methylcitrate dehydratase PrpD